MTNSTAVPNPTGGAEGRRCATQPALHDNLMQAVLAPENMQRAWKQVKSNKGAPDIDRISVQDFPDHARVHWPGIRQALIDGRYRPQPVRQVMIAKPGGGERMLGIPTVPADYPTRQHQFGYCEDTTSISSVTRQVVRSAQAASRRRRADADPTKPR